MTDSRLSVRLDSRFYRRGVDATLVEPTIDATGATFETFRAFDACVRSFVLRCAEEARG